MQNVVSACEALIFPMHERAGRQKIELHSIKAQNVSIILPRTNHGCALTVNNLNSPLPCLTEIL